jgi:NAD(P)-dependent dehydrogenase (short-subunit alcohol dehydrogenase family)
MTPRRALVTGGSRGIGAAIAMALAGSGHRVAVHCRADTTAADVVAAALPAAATLPGGAALPGGGHAVVTGDIADPRQAQAMVTAAVSALGGIDVLVNNAGVYAHQPIDSTSYADWRDSWRRIVDTNVHGSANVTWCVTDHLLNRPEGPGGARIICVGSRGAYRGEPTAPAYGAAKAALHAMAQSLAVALAPHGIAVAAVAPGFARTEMAESVLSGAGGDAIRAQSPFGRVAEPEEVAAAVAWLATPQALWASGAVIDLNGASYLR